ncbi:hypothetical protein FQA39_LY19339 [Lamprigera yunnana]|nr:hypothetical protein FQA39_LY19339 [Lamprigera yunnana]
MPTEQRSTREQGTGRELRLPCNLEFGVPPVEQEVAGEDNVSKLPTAYYLLSGNQTGIWPEANLRKPVGCTLGPKGKLIGKETKKLAVPNLACGLDQLDWRTVRNMLEVIFQDTGVLEV